MKEFTKLLIEHIEDAILGSNLEKLTEDISLLAFAISREKKDNAKELLPLFDKCIKTFRDKGQRISIYINALCEVPTDSVIGQHIQTRIAKLTTPPKSKKPERPKHKHKQRHLTSKL
jgi:hypothetical protein